jgi:hypothetical protein
MKTRIYLVTGFCRQHNRALTLAKAQHRLLSYYYHKEGKIKDDHIPIYVNIGYVDRSIKDEPEIVDPDQEVKDLETAR